MMSYKSVESYLPHSGEMVLIDEIIEVGADFIITKTIIKNHAIFCESLESVGESSESIGKSPSLLGESVGKSCGESSESQVSIDSRDSKHSSQNFAFPTYKTIELMAQSLGIFRALNEKGSGSKLGFLLGARRFEILRPFIVSEARTKVVVSMQDSSGMGVYDCEIFEGENLIARASISALNPSNEFLSQIKEQI